MTPFGSARDVSKFESSKSAGFTRFKSVLQDVSVATEKPSKKKLSDENPSIKVTLRLGNSLMKPQCKFETSAKGQSRRKNRLFSSFDRVAAVRAAMANTTPDKNTGKSPFFIASHSIGLDHCQELPGDRQKWREIHCCVLMQQLLQRRLLVSRLRRSWHLESVVRNGENELVLCFVSVPYILSPSSSFSPRFRLCSFFYLFSHLALLISSYVQYDDGAHKAERSSNASELCVVRQAIQDMTTKLLLFPKLRTVWVFCRCSASGASFGWQIPSQGGLQWCWRVGAVSNFPWIHLDTTHARPNGVMLVGKKIVDLHQSSGNFSTVSCIKLRLLVWMTHGHALDTLFLSPIKLHFCFSSLSVN